MTIKWDSKTMATNVAEVDAQHQEWIRRFNVFDEAISQGHGLDALRSTLDFFANYAEEHFRLEEAQMDAHHCPAAEANRIGHQQMRNILSGFQQYLKYQNVSLVEVAALRMEMYQWLVNHILTVDIRLRDC